MESNALDYSTTYIRENLDLHLVKGRYTTGLVRELADMYEGRTGSVFAIFDEIASLENHPVARPSRTKPPSVFTMPPLKGFWHKHYHQASFLPRNVGNHWRANDFSAHVANAASNLSIPPEKMIGFLAHEMVIGGYRNRSENGRLTGEWIVYASQNGRNTYLTLGIHGDNDAIFRRVLNCADEFPDLELSSEA